MKHKKNNISYKWLWFLFIVIGIIFIIYSKKEGFDNNNIKYLDGIDIIYWINLDRSKGRRDNMKKLFKDQVFNDIPEQRIVAYDGKMDPTSVFDKLNFNLKKRTNTEYACLLSHLEAIRIFNESTNDVALIFEDDVTLEFKKYWNKSVKEIMDNAPPDWEIIMLNYIYSDNRNVLFYDWRKTTEDYEKNINRKYYGCLSYIINKKGANKLMQIYVNNKYNLSDNLDQVSDIYIYQSLNTYVYKYPMFMYKTDNDSTIHSDHIPWHVITKNNIIENYKNLSVNK